MNDIKMNGSAVWNDAMTLLKGNVEIATAVAGVFLFLPLLAFSWFLPPFELPEAPSIDQFTAAVIQWVTAIWPYIVAVGLIGALGNLAIYNAVLDRAKPTVGQALRTAVALFPVCFLAQWLAGMAAIVGFFLLLVPGIYLSIKWMFAPVIIAAEHQTNAIDALRASWNLTKGNSVNIFIFVILLAIVSGIIQALLSLVISLPLLLVPAELGRFLGLLVDTAMQTMVSVLFLFVYMAIYRQLSPSGTAE